MIEILKLQSIHLIFTISSDKRTWRTTCSLNKIRMNFRKHQNQKKEEFLNFLDLSSKDHLLWLHQINFSASLIPKTFPLLIKKVSFTIKWTPLKLHNAPTFLVQWTSTRNPSNENNFFPAGKHALEKMCSRCKCFPTPNNKIKMLFHLFSHPVAYQTAFRFTHNRGILSLETTLQIDFSQFTKGVRERKREIGTKNCLPYGFIDFSFVFSWMIRKREDFRRMFTRQQSGKIQFKFYLCQVAFNYDFFLECLSFEAVIRGVVSPLYTSHNSRKPL